MSATRTSAITGVNMHRSPVLKLFLVLVTALLAESCDLEEYFSGKQVSVEESTATSRVVFRGLRRTSLIASGPASNDIAAPASTADDNTIYFELINTYKGSEFLNVWDVRNFR